MKENCTTDDPLPKWEFNCNVERSWDYHNHCFGRELFRNLRTASSNILVSLSIADGLLAIPLILDVIRLCLKYNCGNPRRIGKVGGTVTLFLLSVIVLHLTLMNSERLIAIKFALRYQALVTKRRSRIVSIAMWLWALVVTIALSSLGCLRQQGKISESVAER